MTRFERDMKEIEEGNGIEIMKRRKAELEELWKKGKGERNAFRLQCLKQEYTKRLDEYEKLDEMFKRGNQNGNGRT